MQSKTANNKRLIYPDVAQFGYRTIFKFHKYIISIYRGCSVMVTRLVWDQA